MSRIALVLEDPLRTQDDQSLCFRDILHSSLRSSHLYSSKKECNVTVVGVSLSEPKQKPPFKKKLKIILNPDHQAKNENLQIQNCHLAHLFPHLGLVGSNFMQVGMQAFVKSAV